MLKKIRAILCDFVAKYKESMEFKDEWLRRRKRRNKDLTSFWKILIRLIALIFVLLLIRFFSTGGPNNFFEYFTKSGQHQTEIIIEQDK